jgi:hypothetical protein
MDLTGGAMHQNESPKQKYNKPLKDSVFCQHCTKDLFVKNNV